MEGIKISIKAPLEKQVYIPKRCSTTIAMFLAGSFAEEALDQCP